MKRDLFQLLAYWNERLRTILIENEDATGVLIYGVEPMRGGVEAESVRMNGPAKRLCICLRRGPPACKAHQACGSC
jgi:hypothetical protein